MQYQPKYYKSIILSVVFLIALSIAVPVLADYLGPNRTVTTTVSVCKVVLKECQFVESKGEYRYHITEDWSCSNESKPWQSYPSNGGACPPGQDHWERIESVEEITVTYDPATIAGSLQNCTLSNGWCGITSPELALSATEPLAGYNITLIEGTLNGMTFACQPGETNCTLPMNQGNNTFNYWAISSWGDSSLMGTTVVNVDTVPPEVMLSVAGTAGKNGWYVSPLQVTANALDATSGVATFEVAVDGGGYQAYTAPISFNNDARHTLQFRATDNAGNLFESPVQNFYVDTTPPTVDLRASWQLGRNVPYDVIDEGSGLGGVRIVIEDDDEKYAKVAWEETVAGSRDSGDIDWNGQFKDGTIAPPGAYLVWLKASDIAGNERFELGKVVVPEPNYVGPVAIPTEEPVALVPPPAELSQPEAAASTSSESAVASVGTGGTTTMHTFTLTSGAAGGTTSSSAATTSSGILWGATAAAVAGVATAYALETTRKRKEAEEAQAAAVKAEVARSKAEHSGQHLTKEERREEKAKQAEVHDRKVQERKERESWANPAKEKAKLKEQEERDRAYQQQLQQQQLKNLQATYSPPPSGISPEAQQAYLHGGAAAQGWINANAPQLQQSYVKQQEQQKEVAQKWEEKKKAEEQAARNAQMLASLPSYYNSEKQYIVPQPTPGDPTLPHPGPRTSSLLGADFAAKIVKEVQDFSVKVLKKVDEGKETVKQWAQTKYEQAKDTVKKKVEETKQWASTKIEKIKQNLKEPYGYLKKSNPPPWLSISGGASLLDKDLFSSDYIGLSSGTGGFWKRFFYEKQTVKYSVSTSGTRNPNGFVEVDVTEGKTSVELGKLTIYGKPLTAEVGFTIKHETKDPNQYTEDVYALDYGWMSSGWITATNKVTIEPSSTSDFEIKTTETIEGKVRKIKGEGPVMIIVGAVVLYYAWPVILPFLPEIKKLIPAWT